MNYFIKFLWLAFVLFTISCKNKMNSNEAYAIIDDNFLEIVDTIAYDYNKLRPAPNQTLLSERLKVYPLTVYSKFIDINVYKEAINQALSNDNIQNRTAYINLNTRTNVENENINLKKIKRQVYINWWQRKTAL